MRWSKAKTRISGQSPQAVGRPVDLLELGVVAQAGRTMPRSRKNSSSSQRGIGRGAAVARDGEGAAGVGVLQARRPVLVGEPALEQARHEAVAGAEHVEDLDREAGAGSRRRRGCRGSRRRRRPRPSAPRLQTSVASETARTARSAAMVSVEPPAMWNSSSVPTIRSKRCSVDCSFAVTSALSTKRLLALAVAGDAPEVRAVVDVERGARAVLARRG